MIGIDDRRGFALPVAIFVITFLTISLAAITAMISSERRVLDNSLAQVEALSLAQSGLDLFLEDRAAYGFVVAPPALLEETRIDLPSGYADVTLEQIRPAVAGSDPLYVVRSLGVLTDPALSGTPLAQRIVAQYARWTTGTMDVRSGWMSLTGLIKNGTAGTISGTDRCGVEPDVAGVSVPNPPGFTTSGNFMPDGDPPVEDMGTPSQAADLVNIDWAGIVDGSALTPDIRIPPDGWPDFSDPNYWPVILVEGNWLIPTDGRGILITTGNVTVSGAIEWDGIILAGGHATGNGNNQVHGATISGLNIMLADDPDAAAAAMGTNSTGNGNKTYEYDSCMVKQALENFGGLATYPDAWTDNWPTY